MCLTDGSADGSGDVPRRISPHAGAASRIQSDPHGRRRMPGGQLEMRTTSTPTSLRRSGAYAARMATDPLQPDPIDEEVARILSDPDLRARLEHFEERFRGGELKTIPHAEVRRRLGLDPPETEPTSDDG